MPFAKAGTVCIASGNTILSCVVTFDQQLSGIALASTNGNAIMVEEQGLHYSVSDYDTTEATLPL